MVAHSAAISRLSRTLDTLVNGPMTEAQTRFATLDDVREDTFVLFCQFAYTGDYETPSCNILQEESMRGFEVATVSNAFATVSVAAAEPAPDTEPPAPFSEPQLDWSSGFGRSSKKSKKPSRKALLRDSFEHKEYSPTNSAQMFVDSCSIQANGGPEEDFTPVFLGHARLYVLAEKYGVEHLKKLVSHKIHKTLVAFTLHETGIGDVVELAQYVYSTENIPDQDQQIDELRALVVLYTICEMDVLSASERFLSFLECGGIFVRDFWMEAKSHFL